MKDFDICLCYVKTCGCYGFYFHVSAMMEKIYFAWKTHIAVLLICIHGLYTLMIYADFDGAVYVWTAVDLVDDSHYYEF